MKRFLSVISIFLFAGTLALQGCSVAVSDKSGETSSADATPAVEVKSEPASEAPKANIGAKVAKDGVFKNLNVYTDAKAPDNHYIPSGWMGDFGDLKMNDKFMTNPHSGSTSLQIIYSNAATQGARWAGIYWQNPPNNWGSRPGGYDLTGAKKVTFWIRGEKGGERIEEVKIGGITGEYADSDVAGIGPLVLTTEWQQFTIDLEGKDLTSISGGFCWATNLDVNPDGATFYLDDIKYE